MNEDVRGRRSGVAERADGRPHDRATDPLRILLVQHSADLSGSTISGQLMAEGFRNAGWQVDVAFATTGPGVARYESLGCRVHVVPHKNWLRGGNPLQSIRRIAAEAAAARGFVPLIRRCEPNVVYINTLVSLSAAIAARRMHVPCIWHIRELFDDVGGEMQIPSLGGKWLVRNMLRRLADRIVVISRATQENVLGPDATANFCLVPNAVADEFFSLGESREQCRAALGLPRRAPLIGVPGTLRPMKGHAFFLKAAARVVAVDRSCMFAVTGDGEAEFVRQLHRLADELGLQSHVRFLGTIANMKQFYQACDLVCVPSRAEPFGRTVIEAFAAGVPVVATAVGGIRETVEQGATGLLVDYDDVEGLSAAMLGLLRDGPLRTRLTNAARRRAIADFSSVQYNRRINGLVQQVLAERQGAAAG